MYLKSLKVCGFKSFADVHTVNFNPGLTAIVGPNGCGKSNIIDAIRWVLGEQRVKALRSEKMEDVIFSGTIRRKPLNFCEVTLTIENDDNVLPVEYNTVAITRRMFRTGESEYFINKRLSRLKDITALFFDTGMGIGSYSLMEQKQIDRVLSDKDEERRTMFEEAAGINKYRNQRKEALRNLLKTSEDLQRLSDLVAEKERTVKMLARHVEKAKKFREYKNELTQIEVAFCHGIFKDISDKIKEESRIHGDLRVQKEMHEAEISTANTLVQEKELIALQKEEKVQESNREMHELSEQMHAVENKTTQLKGRIDGAHRAIEQAEAYQGKLTDTIAKSRDDHAQIERTLIEHETRLADAETAYLACRRDFDNFEIEAAEKKLEHNRGQQKKIGLMEEEAELRANLEKSKSISQNHLENKLSVEHSIAEEKKRGESCGLRIHECRESLKSASEEFSNLSGSRDVLVAKIQSEEHHYRALLETEKTLEATLISDRKKLEFVEELAKNHEGYKEAVRSVVEKGLPGIRGIAADILDVHPDYFVPIESALGSRVQYVLADTHESAQEAIRFLQDGKLGKASFAVREHLQVRPRPQHLGGLEQLDGVIGWAERFVAGKGEFAEMAQLLLNDVLLVRDASVVPAVREQCGDFTVHCMTLQGDSYATNGIVRGGEFGHEELGLLGRTKYIEGLRKSIQKCQTEIEQRENEKTATLLTLEEAKKALLEIDEKINSGRRVRQEHEGNIRHLDEEILRIQTRENEALEQIRHLERRYEENRVDEQRIEQALAVLDESKTETESALLLLEEDLKALDLRRNTVTEALRNAELHFSGLKQEINTLRKEFQKIDQSINDAYSDLEGRREERNKLEIEIEEHTQEIRRLEMALEEARVLRNEKDKEVASRRESYAALQGEVQDLRHAAQDRGKLQSELQEKIHASEMNLERFNEKRRSMVERIWEEYEKDLSALTDEATVLGMTEDEARDKIDVLRKRLKTIGPNVNLSVLEDYEGENKTYEELSRQKTDLETAKGTLEKLIRTLDKEASVKFVETFNQVRENFRNVFIGLFEGGEADIRLEDDPDPLNARIVIYARPSGKSMKGINLLSGGERALTAISLLFGLYLAKPSPYCILDEVDGPLDDANIGRFVNLIRRFSEKTQFLIITHNKKTMAACDILYGVTLVEPGVSNTVSVSLSSKEDERKIDELIGQTVSVN
ncbi:MAG: chromosome segregation protein SMC [Fibrobacterota bacterium]